MGGGFVEWLAIMEPWEFWLLVGFGIVAAVVNGLAFLLAFPITGYDVWKGQMEVWKEEEEAGDAYIKDGEGQER